MAERRMKTSTVCERCGTNLNNGQCQTCTSSSNPLVEAIKRLLRFGEEEDNPILQDLVEARTGTRYSLINSLVKVGRDLTNDISLPDDSSISRQHAWILLINGIYWVEDLGSTNGTYINGKRLSKRSRLKIGDKLRFGKAEFGVIPRAGSNIFEAHGFEIMSELGRGGMGVVYQAVDHKNKRMVAIKKLSLEAVEPQKRAVRTERFKREATVVAKLSHPNIVTVFDLKLEPEEAFYVMEFIEGVTLRKALVENGKPMSAHQFLPILRQVAEALNYAHRMKVTHRDVKPENIFVQEDGVIKLADFGIARDEDLDQGNLTRSGVMLGTLSYVSPEQLNSAKHVDHRADIFSLGALTYEALSGAQPFKGEGIVDTVANIISMEEIPLNELVPEIARGTAQVVQRAMKKDPKERYPSAVEFARDFEASLESTEG
jgi:serine/threonine protein kinase